MIDITNPQQLMLAMYPITTKPMQNLVMAMAPVLKNQGRKSFFGKDKGEAALLDCLGKIPPVIQGLFADEVVSASDTSEHIAREFIDALDIFKLAYPNWQDAYEFADEFLGEHNLPAFVQMVDRMRPR